jgi:hypothetical protein
MDQLRVEIGTVLVELLAPAADVLPALEQRNGITFCISLGGKRRPFSAAHSVHCQQVRTHSYLYLCIHYIRNFACKIAGMNDGPRAHAPGVNASAEDLLSGNF